MLSLRELTEEIAKLLVDTPEEVSVQELSGEFTTVLELRVKREELGKVIGKSGKTARAIRTILNAAAAKRGKKVMLEIIE